MSNSVRAFVESAFELGTGETAVYDFSTLPWGGTPSSPGYVMEDESTGTNVTGTTLTGAGSIAGNILTTPQVHALVSGKTYRMTCTFTTLGQVRTAYAIINCRR